ncbi:MAG: hypothetical protein FWF70_08005 [Bacteroidetes bacterium]|nr:hypothetical protein [Bacteroidota bacterium]MCL1968195.1 hypothetical protein [Bacteroidota bacterium]
MKGSEFGRNLLVIPQILKRRIGWVQGAGCSTKHGKRIIFYNFSGFYSGASTTSSQ